MKQPAVQLYILQDHRDKCRCIRGNGSAKGTEKDIYRIACLYEMLKETTTKQREKPYK